VLVAGGYQVIGLKNFFIFFYFSFGRLPIIHYILSSVI